MCKHYDDGTNVAFFYFQISFHRRLVNVRRVHHVSILLRKKKANATGVQIRLTGGLKRKEIIFSLSLVTGVSNMCHCGTGMEMYV